MDDTYVLVVFSRKTGKIAKSLEGMSSAMLNLWALQNTRKTQDAILFNKASGVVLCYMEGSENFPKVIDENLGNIDDYCPGLLEVVQSE